jgi:ribonuclease BN (tRNA processing enzyme)
MTTAPKELLLEIPVLRSLLGPAPPVTHRKISYILLSSLTGDHQCGFRRNQSTAGDILHSSNNEEI